MSLGRARDRSRARGGGAPVFSPRSLASLAAWWRSDLGVTIATGVSAWADQSGVGDANRTATQGTAGSQPLYTASDAAYAGRPSLSFAAARYLVTGTWSASMAQPWTWYLVGDTASGGVVVSLDGNAGNTRQLGVTSSNPYLFDGVTIINGAGAPGASPHVACMVSNGASSAVYVNNSQTAAATGSQGATTPNTVWLGIASSLTAGWGGRIVEVIGVGAAHNAAQRQQVFQYLGARYAIAVS